MASGPQAPTACSTQIVPSHQPAPTIISGINHPSSLPFRLNIDVLCVDYAFILLLFLSGRSASAIGGCACAGETACLSSASGLSRFVHRLGQLVRSLGKPLARRVHR